MDISFANRRLRRQLENDKEMRKAFGDRSRAIRRRLAVLQAARTLAEVPVAPPERRHQLSGEWAGHFAVDIARNWRLVFRPKHDPLPLLPDGGIDLDRVTAIEIVGIVDYH